jgi:hypothetical protein
MNFAVIYGRRGVHDDAPLRQSQDTYTLPYSQTKDKHLKEKVLRVLQGCGGQILSNGDIYFDYDFEAIREDLLVTGLIPDQKAYQFYPTPEPIAKKIVELAGIESGHRTLEPSAGIGGLADFIPADDLTCVELAELNCRILREKGFSNVVEADFLTWRHGKGLFDRIVLNPPFSMSRAEAHFTAAAEMLNQEGVLVALLPDSLRGKSPLAGFDYEWEALPAGSFPGVSIDLSILKVTRKAFV